MIVDRMGTVAIAVIGVACSGTSQRAQPGAGSASALVGSHVAAPPSVGCASQLRDYLAALAADGPTPPNVTATLVPIDAPPRPAPFGLGITLESNDRVGDSRPEPPSDRNDRGKPLFAMRWHGLADRAPTAPSTVTSTPRRAVDLLTKELSDERIAGMPISLIVDRSVPWSFVAAITQAANATQHSQVHVAFRAAGSTRARVPEPSSIDAALANDDSRRPAMSLDEALDTPSLVNEVYRDCPQARALFSSLPTAGDREKALIDGLPPAVEACGCKVEVAAAKRLLWRLWGRDLGPLHTWITLELGAGTQISLPAETSWADAYERVIAAARAGGTIDLR